MEALAESKVCSLNLSQNLLSDKACFILQASPISQNLKTITLSLNKINKGKALYYKAMYFNNQQ